MPQNKTKAKAKGPRPERKKGEGGQKEGTGAALTRGERMLEEELMLDAQAEELRSMNKRAVQKEGLRVQGAGPRVLAQEERVVNEDEEPQKVEQEVKEEDVETQDWPGQESDKVEEVKRTCAKTMVRAKKTKVIADVDEKARPSSSAAPARPSSSAAPSQGSAAPTVKNEAEASDAETETSAKGKRKSKDNRSVASMWQEKEVQLRSLARCIALPPGFERESFIQEKKREFFDKHKVEAMRKYRYNRSVQSQWAQKALSLRRSITFKNLTDKHSQEQFLDRAKEKFYKKHGHVLVRVPDDDSDLDQGPQETPEEHLARLQRKFRAAKALRDELETRAADMDGNSDEESWSPGQDAREKRLEDFYDQPRD